MANDNVGAMVIETTFERARQMRVLNRLIVGCKDDGHAYRNAARDAVDPERRRQLLEMSRRRSAFAGELGVLVDDMGGSHAEHGSLSEALHRGARVLKVALAGPHEGDVFRECARIEGGVAARYEKALGRSWPEAVRLVVSAQSREIESDHTKMRVLRGLY